MSCQQMQPIDPNPVLARAALKTCWGVCMFLISSVMVLTVLTVLNLVGVVSAALIIFIV